MLTIEDALLLRAEHCHGSINYIDIPKEISLTKVLLTVGETIGNYSTWVTDAEAAMWQSLLTREVLLTGGLDA